MLGEMSSFRSVSRPPWSCDAIDDGGRGVSVEFDGDLGPLRINRIEESEVTVPHGKTLYARLGGYDAIVAVVESLLPRLMGDSQLGRFWAHRGTDGLLREKQLLIDFLCHCSGGPLLYTGRNMTKAHRGMGISAADWTRFIGHVQETLNGFPLPDAERREVVDFIESTRSEIVE